MSESQYIKIENFRCFKELEVKGFKRVNLIGGKNNAGKTSLLEALLVYFYPIPQSIIMLKQGRKESFETISKNPQDTWKNFFYNKKELPPINISGYFYDFEKNKVTITVIHPVQLSLLHNSKMSINSDLQLGLPGVTLKIHQYLNQEEPIERSLLASRAGIMSDISEENNIPFVSSSFFISNKDIAQQYDKVAYDGKSEAVIKILRIIDPSITELRTFSFVEPTLYIQTTTQPRGLPISLFGDAIFRVTAIILKLLNQDHKVLFIDEIENGIHYTNQQSFWEGLFALAQELDTLIFATTHSLEMIKAFTAAAKKFPDQGTYFELAYSPRTDKIVAINRDIDLLEYALERGKAIRGE